MTGSLPWAGALALLISIPLAPVPASAQAAASPYTSAVRYDAVGRVTGTISADPDTVGSGNPFIAVRNSYDGAGRLIKVETGTLASWRSEAVAPANWGAAFVPARTLETTYDIMGRKTRDSVREDGSGAIRTVTQYSYDAAGRPECTAVRMNPALFASLPESACTPGTPGAPGTENDFGPDRITRTVYDAAGQRVQLREGVGSDAEGTEASWAYNFNGQVVAVIDGNGNRAQLVYDGHGRQNCWMFPSTTRAASFNDATQASALASAGALSGTITGGHCASGDYEAYEYDPNGNRTALRKRDGTSLAYSYDALNRVTVKTVPERPAPHPYPLTAAQTRDVHYGYDLRGLQLYARFDSASGEGVTSVYDGFGRVSSSSTDMGGTTRTLAYQYDRNGNRIRITHPDPGSGPGQAGPFFVYEYDALSRFTGIDENGISDIASLSYHQSGEPFVLGRGWAALGWLYDPLGRATYQIADLPAGAGTSWTLQRNPASGIRSTTRSNDAYAWTGHYGVDRSYAANGLNQYSAAGGANFTYDANGNLITTPGPQPGQTIAYTYDIENRLVGTSTGVQLGYDPLGRLAWTTGSPNYTSFLYDGDALVAEYDYSGTLTERYVHGPAAGVDDPLFWYHGSAVAYPNRRQLFADPHGSIVAVTDVYGNRLAVNAYDEYGIPAATNTGRFQYTGQIWLAELGMYHYKARIYSPTLGRFLQTDPVGYEDQINLYAYVGNDPVNYVDPTGEFLACLPPATPGDQGYGACKGFGSPRPAHAVPGGRLTEAHVRCRSCHGVGTADDRRYATDEENAFFLDLTMMIIPLPLPTKFLTIARRAEQLAARAGRSSVTIRSPTRGMRVDLRGGTHGGTPTPHTQRQRVYQNPRNPSQRRWGNEGRPTPTTPAELRLIDNFLRSIGL